MMKVERWAERMVLGSAVLRVEMKDLQWDEEWVGLMVATMAAESVVCSEQNWVVELVQGMAAQWDGR